MMMFNATFRCCLIGTVLVPIVPRATAQTYSLTLKANVTELLVGTPIFITVTLTNISRTDQTGYKVMGDLRVFIRADNEDKYALYEAGVYPKKKIKRRLKTMKPGESWDFREIILYQDRYDPYAANPRSNESGLRLKDPGRYWIIAKYPGAGRLIESDPIAVDVSLPTSRLDRWVFDVLTCRDQESQRRNLNEKERLQCMNRYCRLLHTGEDPSTWEGVHLKRFPEFAITLWSLLEQGAGASRYGSGIKWALRQRIDQIHGPHKEPSLTQAQKHLIEDAPIFKRGTG